MAIVVIEAYHTINCYVDENDSEQGVHIDNYEVWLDPPTVVHDGSDEIVMRGGCGPDTWSIEGIHLCRSRD